MARSDGLLRAAAGSGRRGAVCSVTCGARGRGLSRAVGSAVTRPARKPGQSRGGTEERDGADGWGRCGSEVQSTTRGSYQSGGRDGGEHYSSTLPPCGSSALLQHPALESSQPRPAVLVRPRGTDKHEPPRGHRRAAQRWQVHPLQRHCE